MIFKDDEREIWLKVVYYGPGLAGKTTNFQYVYERTDPARRGKMVSLATETERTLSFDFVPASLGPVAGHTPRFHLYTVPGPVFYDVSKRLVLDGVDGIVFVADAQVERSDANAVSLENLEENLEVHGRKLIDVPFVLQYNKVDLPNRMPLAELEEELNRRGVPSFEAVARTGVGVFDTLKALAKRMVAGVGDAPYR